MKDVLTTGEETVGESFNGWVGRSYTGPRIRPLRQLSTFNFTSLVPKPAYTYDTLEEWRQIMNKIVELTAPLVNDLANDRLRAIELEHLEKGLVNWRAQGYGRLLFASPFRSESTAQAEHLRPFIRKRWTAYRKVLEACTTTELLEVYLGTRIRLDKGKGAPFWNPGSDRGAGLLLGAIGRQIWDVDGIEETMHEWSQGAPMLLTMYSRIQGNRKKLAKRVLYGNSLYASGEWVGCKVRTVKAPPFVLNSLSAPGYDLLKWVILKAFPHRHLTDSRVAAQTAHPYRYLFASDLTTADDTISADTLEVWHEEMFAPFITYLLRRGVVTRKEARYLLAYDIHLIRTKILAPARTRNEGACIIEMVGGVKSGDRGTTDKDLDIIAALCDAKRTRLAEAGILCEYMSWGDDILIMSDNPKAESAWFSACDAENHLWKEKREPDSTYMSKHMPGGYSYFSRMLVRRINREPAEEPTNDIGAALSIRASLDALQGPSEAHPLRDRYVAILRRAVPKLRVACEIAEHATTLELMHTYERLKMTRLQKMKAATTIQDLMRGTGGDDEADTDMEESLFTGGPALYSEKVGGYVEASISERDLRKETTKWPLKTALRKMQTPRR